MASNTQTIAVIICAHSEERWHTLREAVASAQRQTRPAEELIVVIDHNENLLQRAQNQFQDALVLENTEVRGLSGARNSGIKMASAEIIAFLDDDAIADPHWLEHLCAPFHDERVLGSGGTVIPYWHDTPPTWFPAEFYWVVGCSYKGLPEQDAIIRNPIGANMAIRRQVFEEVGGFRSSIGRIGSRPVGCEETELCIRARQHWPHRFFLYSPAAHVRHYIPVRRTTWRYFYARCYAEGLSKALVSHFVGTRESLSSERQYMRRTLPLGILRGTARALFQGDISGLVQAIHIIGGLGVTGMGYLTGMRHSKPGRAQQQIAATPTIFSQPLSQSERLRAL